MINWNLHNSFVVFIYKNEQKKRVLKAIHFFVGKIKLHCRGGGSSGKVERSSRCRLCFHCSFVKCHYILKVFVKYIWIKKWGAPSPLALRSRLRLANFIFSYLQSPTVETRAAFVAFARGRSFQQSKTNYIFLTARPYKILSFLPALLIQPQIVMRKFCRVHFSI